MATPFVILHGLLLSDSYVPSPSSNISVCHFDCFHFSLSSSTTLFSHLSSISSTFELIVFSSALLPIPNCVVYRSLLLLAIAATSDPPSNPGPLVSNVFRWYRAASQHWMVPPILGCHPVGCHPCEDDRFAPESGFWSMKSIPFFNCLHKSLT